MTCSPPVSCAAASPAPTSPSAEKPTDAHAAQPGASSTMNRTVTAVPPSAAPAASAAPGADTAAGPTTSAVPESVNQRTRIRNSMRPAERPPARRLPHHPDQTNGSRSAILADRLVAPARHHEDRQLSVLDQRRRDGAEQRGARRAEAAR